jgi:GcrA cell cycle regulator
MSFLWSDERVELLKALWDKGLSATQIAAQLGGALSRNAVSGKARRIGLYRAFEQITAAKAYGGRTNMKGHSLRRIAQQTRAAAAPKRKPQAPLPAIRVSETRTYAQPEPQPRPVFRPEPTAATAKPWLERRFGECAAPVSGEGADVWSCCAPAPNGPYCAAHRARFYTKAATEAQKKAAIKAREAKAKQMRRAAA